MALPMGTAMHSMNLNEAYSILGVYPPACRAEGQRERAPQPITTHQPRGQPHMHAHHDPARAQQLVLTHQSHGQPHMRAHRDAFMTASFRVGDVRCAPLCLLPAGAARDCQRWLLLPRGVRIE